MKILQVIPHYLPSTHFGGTPVACHNLSKNLVTLGHQVDVLTTDVFSETQRHNINGEPESRDGYNIYRFRNLSNLLAYRNRFATPIPSLRFFIWQLKTYNVVQLYEYRNLLNVLLCLCKPLTKAVYILYPQGTYPIYNTQIFFKKLFDVIFTRIINQAIDKYVAISKIERKSLVKSGIPKNKITTIYYGVDVVETKFLEQKLFPHPYILYLGRIDKRKGVDLLIEAYKQSAVASRGIHLVVVGNDNNFVSVCKNLVKKLKLGRFVHFIGPASGAKKTTLYKDAKIVSYVTENEAYGFVPMEAALCGTASIVAGDSGVAEVFKEFHICHFTKYGDVGALAKVLKRLANRENRVAQVKISNIRRKYSWLKVAKGFISIYKNV